MIKAAHRTHLAGGLLTVSEVKSPIIMTGTMAACVVLEQELSAYI